MIRFHFSPVGSRLVLGAVMLALLAGGLTGCRRGPKARAKTSATAVALAAKPEPIVLDYRNGWFHPASGKETIQQVAALYDRDAELVGKLNNASTGARPIKGIQLYIPPSNDRALVRETLVRIQNRPELVPKEPWRPDLEQVKHASVDTKRVIASKTPATKKTVVASGSLVENEAQASAEKAKTAVDASKTAAAVNLAELSTAAADQQVASASAEKRVQPKLDPNALARHEKPAAVKAVAAAPAAAAKAQPKAAAPSPAAPAAAGGKFLWPVKGEVVTKFKGGWKSACHGIEIRAEESTPVRAARAGKVLLAQKFPGYGQMVLIDHGDGYATVYAYNQQLLVQPDQVVKQGDTIASVGRPTRGSKGTLFFQVRRDAQPVDPLTYLN